MKVSQKRAHLAQDIIIIGASVIAAIWFFRSGVVIRVLEATSGIPFIQTLFAGSLFTSAFTTAPAIVLLGGIAKTKTLFWAAGVGGLGALLGDLIIFAFVKDRFADDILALVKKQGVAKLHHIFATRLFRWFSPFVAALIIASPLPDELGIALLGFSKTRISMFILFSFLANATGIFIILSLLNL